MKSAAASVTMSASGRRRWGNDVMSPESRSALMSRIRGKDTLPERRVSELLRRRGFRWESHVPELPGRPDLVFWRYRVAIFIDGDFWHGWRFPAWRHKLSPFWQAKIAANRARDRRTHARLRRHAWTVVRVWEHEVRQDVQRVADRIAAALQQARATNGIIRHRNPLP